MCAPWIRAGARGGAERGGGERSPRTAGGEPLIHFCSAFRPDRPRLRPGLRGDLANCVAPSRRRGSGSGQPPLVPGSGLFCGAGTDLGFAPSFCISPPLLLPLGFENGGLRRRPLAPVRPRLPSVPSPRPRLLRGPPRRPPRLRHLWSIVSFALGFGRGGEDRVGDFFFPSPPFFIFEREEGFILKPER